MSRQRQLHMDLKVQRLQKTLSQPANLGSI